MIRRHFLAGVVGLKAMCAAAALMVGVGQAEAATVPSGTYAVEITLTENVWFCFSTCADPEPATQPYRGLNLGETISAIFDLQWPEPGKLKFDLTWASGSVSSDNGPFASQWFETRPNFFYNSVLEQIISFDIVDGLLSGFFVDDYYFGGGWNQNATIAFQGADVAPVPLPATAALLPLGIGALAAMRKRRKA